MAKKNNINNSALSKLCSYIVLASQQGQLINDTLQAQDKVFSSKHVTDLINSMSEQDRKYVDDIVANLNKLSSKTTNIIPDSSNAEPNTLYLYSADPNPTSYNQYMVLSDKTILNLGTTNISLDGYLKEIDADGKYLKQADSHTHSNKLILDSMSQDKIDKWDSSVSENKVKEIIDSERPITTTINSSSTDAQIPSAKSVYDNIKTKNTMQPAGTLANYSTVFDWAVANIGATCAYEGNSNNFTDCPLGGEWGTLVCIGTKVENGLKVLVCRNHNSDILVRTIRRSKGVNEWVESTWQRLCITTVENKYWTTIKESTLTNTTFVSGGNCSYSILNGIAYIRFNGLTTTSASTITAPEGTFPIPNPKITNAHCPVVTSSGNTALCNISSNGGLSIRLTSSIGDIYTTISYPVAES